MKLLLQLKSKDSEAIADPKGFLRPDFIEFQMLDEHGRYSLNCLFDRRRGRRSKNKNSSQ